MELIPRVSLIIYLKHIKHERQIRNMDILFILINLESM